jgi:hypothetical protein
LEDGLDDDDWVRLSLVLRAGVPRAGAHRLMGLQAVVRRQGDPAHDGAMALRSQARRAAGVEAPALGFPLTPRSHTRYAGPADAGPGTKGT